MQVTTYRRIAEMSAQPVEKSAPQKIEPAWVALRVKRLSRRDSLTILAAHFRSRH